MNYLITCKWRRRTSSEWNYSHEVWAGVSLLDWVVEKNKSDEEHILIFAVEITDEQYELYKDEIY